jgi:hypothetical protein
MSYTPLEDTIRSTGHQGSRHHSNDANAIEDEFHYTLTEPLHNHNTNTQDASNTSASSPVTPRSPPTATATASPTLSNADDPFYMFRDDLYQQLSRVDETLTEYLRVVHQTVRIRFSYYLAGWIYECLPSNVTVSSFFHPFFKRQISF